MKNNERKICPACGKPMKQEEQLSQCPICKTAHHHQCWVDNLGCSKPNCPNNYHVRTVRTKWAQVNSGNCDNIVGTKIQKYADRYFRVSTILNIVALVIIPLTMIDTFEEFGFGSLLIWASICLGGIGIAWGVSLFMKGFGELICKTVEVAENTRRIAENTKSKE